MDDSKLKNHLDKFYIDWETIAVVLGNYVAIDIPKLSTTNRDMAAAFLTSYGYDPYNYSQSLELQKLRDEALNFMERHLLSDPDRPGFRLEIPEPIYKQQDVMKLMVMASTEDSWESKWSCSLLRVMHTLTHVRNDLSANFFPAVQKQILDRVLQFVHTDPAGDVYLGQDETGIRLYMLDIKTQKSSDSLVLKMLHKPENVSSYIFDRIGFRFVTYNRLEALLALKYLNDHVFAFPNIIPSRSRNTLVHIGKYHSSLDRLIPIINNDDLTEHDLEKCIEDLVESDECQVTSDDDESNVQNLYSSTKYTSMQVTCRQLIRVMAPKIAEVAALDDTQKEIEYKFFFPYEVQILDKTSYVESRRGRASHTEYKKSQLRAARERIFPWLEEVNIKS